jgi:hypothetical protein
MSPKRIADSFVRCVSQENNTLPTRLTSFPSFLLNQHLYESVLYSDWAQIAACPAQESNTYTRRRITNRLDFLQSVTCSPCRGTYTCILLVPALGVLSTYRRRRRRSRRNDAGLRGVMP